MTCTSMSNVIDFFYLAWQTNYLRNNKNKVPRNKLELELLNTSKIQLYGHKYGKLLITIILCAY